jgi:hypothetical protein
LASLCSMLKPSNVSKSSINLHNHGFLNKA